MEGEIESMNSRCNSLRIYFQSRQICLLTQCPARGYLETCIRSLNNMEPVPPFDYSTTHCDPEEPTPRRPSVPIRLSSLNTLDNHFRKLARFSDFVLESDFVVYYSIAEL
ncbi:hypothetical protein ACJMK2_031831 [Sinanodonta woodiana]|uniref:Uncharacterized protein n=1 Tax=Sinanodonta woodiana TaxID=1069815 RepID=A0ABD3X0H3_SINWO